MERHSRIEWNVCSSLGWIGSRWLRMTHRSLWLLRFPLVCTPIEALSDSSSSKWRTCRSSMGTRIFWMVYFIFLFRSPFSLSKIMFLVIFHIRIAWNKLEWKEMTETGKSNENKRLTTNLMSDSRLREEISSHNRLITQTTNCCVQNVKSESCGQCWKGRKNYHIWYSSSSVSSFAFICWIFLRFTERKHMFTMCRCEHQLEWIHSNSRWGDDWIRGWVIIDISWFRIWNQSWLSSILSRSLTNFESILSYWIIISEGRPIVLFTD